jgi:hypothetical protein
MSTEPSTVEQYTVAHSGEGVRSTETFGERLDQAIRLSLSMFRRGLNRAAHAEVLNAAPVRMRECSLLTVLLN